jgi:hypothetical protein
VCSKKSVENGFKRRHFMEHIALMAELTNCVVPVSDISVSLPASSDDETDAQANVFRAEANQIPDGDCKVAG